LHDGVFENVVSGDSLVSFSGNLNEAAVAIASAKTTGLEVSVFESIAIGTGAYANNPWLQELPDPITKVTWENTLAISQKTANEQGLENGDWAKLTANGYEIELPVLIQP